MPASVPAQHLTLVKSEAKASVLRAEALMKRYRKRTVVQDVSLAIQSGEVVGLLGPNGAGKTTCFYMIVGLVPADAGRIDLDGRDLHAWPARERGRCIAWLAQQGEASGDLTARDVVMLGRIPHIGLLGAPARVAQAERRRRAAAGRRSPPRCPRHG